MDRPKYKPHQIAYRLKDDSKSVERVCIHFFELTNAGPIYCVARVALWILSGGIGPFMPFWLNEADIYETLPQAINAACVKWGTAWEECII